MWRFLFPSAESDPEIRAELAVQGRVGLTTMALIGAILAASGLVNSTISWTTSSGLVPGDAIDVAFQNQSAVLAACAMILSLSFFRRARLSLRTTRVLGLALVVLLGALMLRPEVVSRFTTAPAALAFVYVVVVALMPLRPVTAFALGLALTGSFAVATRGVEQSLDASRAIPAFLNGSVAGTILAGMLYRVRRRYAERQVEAHHYAAELERANRELEETRLQLVQTEKMASLGNLAAGVAHEINTPVGAIKANAEITERALSRLEAAIEVDDPEAAQKPLRALRSASATTLEATRRIVRIVKSLRSFARLDEADEAWADLNECVQNTLPLLQHELEDGVRVELDLDDVPKARFHPNQINQVIMNVMLNAIQAVEGSGSVTVRTRANDAEVSLEVEDDGSGIRPEHESRIFDPGFTTKGVGVGTGLGLSITYRIVHAHGGTIAVDTHVGRGTKMTITLPRERAAKAAS